MSALKTRTARAVIWFTRIQDGAMTERRTHWFNRWLALPANKNVFEFTRTAWHNTPPIELEEELSIESQSRMAVQAAYWYFRCVDEPRMPCSDRREFVAWMRSSPEHVAELFKVAQLDGKLRRLKLTMRSLGLSRSNVVEFAERRREAHEHDESSAAPKRRFAYKLAGLAASLVLGVTLAFVAQDYMQPEQIVTTGASQWHDMTLPDGTAVHVDARSKVEVEFTDEARIVHVYQGSAVFEVAQDSQRRFIARTHLIDATAIGTRFGVSIDPGVTTTVSEGVVTVTGRGRSDRKSVTLKAGEELRVSDSQLTAPRFAHVDAERTLQWAKDGMLVLGGLTVSEGAAQLNRRNQVQIVVDSPTLGTKVMTFVSVKANAPETYAKAVALESGVTMTIDKENGVIRLSE